ncbi:MAG: dTMP kinase [Thermodesulfobacteriota bacterium]|nr:dTMP kinase [Thermodesulfobacteriota bacterium]
MFITLEGIEGSGKTSQVERIARFFNNAGYDTIVTREPGDTDIGKKIRSILLDPENNGISPLCELLLYGADRAQHLFEVVVPSLKAGKIVLCDRFADATAVYQGAARGIEKSLIDKIHEIVVKELKPDLTILFDLDPETGLERTFAAVKTGQRSETETRFEQERIEFHEKVRKGYLALAGNEKQRFLIVDASKNKDEVFEQILSGIKQRLCITATIN